MLAIIAPGQGSQTPGMLTEWLQDQSIKDLVAKWSLHIDLDLERLGTTASADEIRDTANAQPLIVAAGLIAFHKLGITKFTSAAGHSVGELTAAAVAGVLTPVHALEFVRQRGIAMAKAASESETGMSAVLGGDRDDVLKTLSELGLTAANDNGAGQIVAAGSLDALEKLNGNPPESARVRALAVAGAFHTSVMKPAVDHVAAFLPKVNISNPKVALLSNKDGATVGSGEDAANRIVAQVANPVRWDLCMVSLRELGITGVIELPPAGTLVGLLKRAEPGIETFALKSPEDLVAAKEFAAKHGGA